MHLGDASPHISLSIESIDNGKNQGSLCFELRNSTAADLLFFTYEDDFSDVVYMSVVEYKEDVYIPPLSSITAPAFGQQPATIRIKGHDAISGCLSYNSDGLSKRVNSFGLVFLPLTTEDARQRAADFYNVEAEQILTQNNSIESLQKCSEFRAGEFKCN
jgi:hypothetical protein